MFKKRRQNKQLQQQQNQQQQGKKPTVFDKANQRSSVRINNIPLVTIVISLLALFLSTAINQLGVSIWILGNIMKVFSYIVLPAVGIGMLFSILYKRYILLALNIVPVIIYYLFLI